MRVSALLHLVTPISKMAGGQPSSGNRTYSAGLQSCSWIDVHLQVACNELLQLAVPHVVKQAVGGCN